MCDAIAVDSAGRAYLTGNTTSASFPVTPGAFDTTYTLGQEAFVARFNAAGSKLEYATFLGGSDWEYATPRCAIAIDKAGRAYVAGETDSSDFPTTPSAYDRTFNGGYVGGDAFRGPAERHRHRAGVRHLSGRQPRRRYRRAGGG